MSFENLSQENKDKYEEMEERKIVLGNKIKNPQQLKDQESSLKYIDEFLELCDKQQAIKKYNMIKNKKVQAIKMMKGVIEKSLILKEDNRALWERTRNTVHNKLINIAKAFKKHGEK